MNFSHNLVGSRVRSLDGGALGRILAVEEHRTGVIVGARVEWDEPIKTPTGTLTATNVFWSRVELVGR